MASLAELIELVETAKANGCDDLTLLKCTSSYPATPAGSNLATIPHMKTLFDCTVGLSDHTLGIGVAVASIAFWCYGYRKTLYIIPCRRWCRCSIFAWTAGNETTCKRSKCCIWGNRYCALWVNISGIDKISDAVYILWKTWRPEMLLQKQTCAVSVLD